MATVRARCQAIAVAFVNLRAEPQKIVISREAPISDGRARLRHRSALPWVAGYAPGAWHASCPRMFMRNLPGPCRIGLARILVSAALLACRSEKPQPTVSPEMRELREQAGLHPTTREDDGPSNSAGSSGHLTEDSPELREEAALHPVKGEDHAESPEELRKRLDLRADKSPPPANEAEMRRRAGLHDDAQERKRRRADEPQATGE